MRGHSGMSLYFVIWSFWNSSVDDLPLWFEASRIAPGIVPSSQAVSKCSSIEDMFRCLEVTERQIC